MNENPKDTKPNDLTKNLTQDPAQDLTQDLPIGLALISETTNDAGKALSLVDRAVIFAVRAHAGAFRKSSRTPYIIHPLEAAVIAAALALKLDPEARQNVIAAAVLHDTLEDTGTTEETITEKFGPEVLRLIKSDSENKRPELPSAETWQIRKQETIDFVREKAAFDEKIIIFADKLSNLRSIYADTRVIGDEIWKRFNIKEKSRHAWYYGAFIEYMKEFEGEPGYEEYKWLYDAVFN